MTQQEQLLRALEFFKDSSVVQWIAAIASIGWVIANRGKFSRLAILRACMVSLGLSALFALFALSLIPLVAENLNPSTRSIYDVRPAFHLLFGELIRVSGVGLTLVAWPQHVLFLAGIGLYIWGTIERRHRPRTSAPIVPAHEADHEKRRTFNPNA